MKYNKGFAPVLIAIIIAGALVIGGGAYYLGTKKNVENKQVIKNPNITENNLVQNNNANNGSVTIFKKCSVYPAASIGLDSTTPVAQNITAGSKNVPLLSVKISAVNCDISVKSISLYSLPTANSANDNLDSLKAYNGLTLIATNTNLAPDEGMAIGTGPLSSSLIVKQGQSVVITIKGDVKPTASGQLAIGLRGAGIWEAATNVATADIEHIGTFPKGNTMNIINSNISEESSTESFKNQPGAIKSITSNGTNKWIFAVDLLSANPKWTPGGSEEFFLNQNTKIRNLSITANTKIYNCDGRGNPYLFAEVAGYISRIQDLINKSKTDPGLVGHFGYTADFDISGTNITTIYEQCLP